jgi:hypothetical protein
MAYLCGHSPVLALTTRPECTAAVDSLDWSPGCGGADPVVPGGAFGTEGPTDTGQLARLKDCC